MIILLIRTKIALLVALDRHDKFVENKASFKTEYSLETNPISFCQVESV